MEKQVINNMATHTGSRMPARRDETTEAREWLVARIARARKVGLFAEQGTLTPALAKVLLEDHNGRNRPYRPVRASFFADMIARGEWLMYSDGIAIATDANINNGQHRCGGVIESGMSVPCLFFFGERPEAFHLHDTAAKRTAADVVQIAGHTNSSTQAAAAKLLLLLERGRATAGSVRLSHTQILGYIEAHPKLAVSAAAGARFCKAIKRTSAGGATAAHYLISQRSRHTEKLDEFWDKICTGFGLHVTHDPIVVARNAAINGKLTQSRSDAGTWVAAGIINAWNLRVQRKKAVSVTWRGGDFPEVI